MRGVKEIKDYVNREELPQCKFCGSTDVVRYGYGLYTGEQRYFCKKCKRKFVPNKALPGMRTPIEQIADVLSLFYGGLSLKEIRRHLGQHYEQIPSRSTIYRHITRFTKIAINKAKEYTPKVGDVWVADETVLDIGGRKVWYWDLIDTDTRFLLSSHMSLARTIADAKTLVEKAAEKAGKPPKVIITDKLQAYMDGIELAFGADTKHIATKGLTEPINTNLIERFHSSLKTRMKVMRGMKRLNTARLLLDGWLVHYNFFRGHHTLSGSPPAVMAGIKFPFKDWVDVVESQFPIIATNDKKGEKQADCNRIQAIRASPMLIGARQTRRVRLRKRKPRRQPIISIQSIRA